MRTPMTMLLVAAALPASAQDFPGYGGKAQSQTNPTTITWQCAPAREGPISCTLVETSVSHPPALEADAEAIKMLAPDFLAECGEIETIRSQIPEQLRTATADGKMSAAQAQVVTNYMDAMQRVCADRSREAVNAFVALQNDVASRTCSVSTSVRQVEFGWNASSNRWESITPPSGGCGEIDITAMEKADAFFWNLRRQKIVTNRTGTDILGGSCAATPDVNETYEWRTRDVHMGCEFVKFGR